jgi:putative sterol carrier protein
VALDVFTDVWAAAWAREINASEAFRVAAGQWRSAFVFVMRADAEAGVAEPRAVYLDLAEGECRAGRAATGADLELAPYVLSASPAVWRQVLCGELEPVGAVMTGLLDLSRGSLVGLAPWVGAAKQMLDAAGRVESGYPPSLA